MARKIIFVVIAAMLSASSLLAGQTDIPGNVKLAKINPDDVSYQPKQLDVVRKLLVNEKYKFYDVKGQSAAEIRKEMKLNGTKWNDGKVYAALTSWDIQYHYDVIFENGKYRIKSASTDIDVVINMPRWKPEQQATRELIEEWERYIRVLDEHETGHRDLAVKAAGEINEILAGLGDFSSKAELDREAKKQAQARLKRMKEIQVEYDNHTNHGIKQGAALVG
ncbi:MAG: hypothetical protein A2079_00385 [Geobacteraceae bacterium GWC2_48_7]|nr:MAG: hypothetical protein A2079_00385 [Geobacteraceae bacterium GWC2_48_7]